MSHDPKWSESGLAWHGLCKGCGRWVPRDEMQSINVDVYDSGQKARKIKIRLCPPCYSKKVAELDEFKWQGLMKHEYEIKLEQEIEKERTENKASSHVCEN